MTWLHMPPMRPPAPPPHVALERLMGAIAQQEALGLATPASGYLRLMCPKMQLDKWGIPLPLSDVDQDRVDRLFAVLVQPLERLRVLLHCGMLMDEENDAVKTAFPEVYTVIVEETLREMMQSAPPYREWAETTIGVLFGMPPAQLLQTAGPSPEQQSAQASAPKTTRPASDRMPGTQGTAADRRDIGVRAEQRR
jgi:hypothetical protein